MTGLDISDEMLRHSREHAGDTVKAGQVSFVKADAADFGFPGLFSGWPRRRSTPRSCCRGIEALRGCFACTRRSVSEGGLFVFDLMTRRGFVQDYDTMWVSESDEDLCVYRGVFDGVDKATARMLGIVRGNDG